MLTLEGDHGHFHGSEIQRAMDMAGEPTEQRGRPSPIPNTVLIQSASRVPPRIKGVRDRFEFLDSDIRGRQSVKPPLEFPKIHWAGTVKVCHLTCRVDPCIGPTGGMKPNLFTQDLTESPLQYFLDGPPIGLNLPTMIVSPVVLNDKLKVHWKARISEVRNQQSRTEFRLLAAELLNAP